MDRVPVGLREVHQGIAGDGVLDVDESGELPAGSPVAGGEDVAFVEVEVAESG